MSDTPKPCPICNRPPADHTGPVRSPDGFGYAVLCPTESPIGDISVLAQQIVSLTRRIEDLGG